MLLISDYALRHYAADERHVMPVTIVTPAIIAAMSFRQRQHRNTVVATAQLLGYMPPAPF